MDRGTDSGRSGRRLHLVGMGGSGMSSLAALLLARGDEVSGSDTSIGAAVEALRDRGARVFDRQVAGNVDAKIEAVVHTAAVRAGHPELEEARRLGIRIFKYAEFVAEELERGGPRVVAVAGTHGKTTTTSIVAHVLREAGRAPNCVVGGWPLGWDTPALAGGGPHFVLEACEYDHSFLRYRPHSALITNVEGDHLDYFGTEAAVVDAFQRFLGRIQPGGGPVVLHENAARALDLGRCPVRPVVMGERRGVTDRLEIQKPVHGRRSARLHLSQGDVLALECSLPGEHNLGNAALAASVCVRLGVDPRRVETAIASFRGVRRRLERLGMHEGAEWFTDYAHHPTEVSAVRDALRQHRPSARLCVVFQPHQVSRTRTFRQRFVEALRGLDEVVFPGIYAAREPQEVVRAAEDEFEAALREGGIPVLRCDGLDDVLPALARRPARRDVVVLMGAGDIEKLAEPFRTPRALEATAGV